jgi:acyl-CoA thioesterase I
MNPVALYFASGESLYAGSSALMLAIVLSPLLRRPWMLRLRNLGAWLGLSLIAMACPPFSCIVYVMLLGLFASWFVLSQWTSGPIAPRLQIGTGTALLAVLLVISTLEFSRRKMPTITGVGSDHLVVIGDSISSGIDPHVASWPVVMQQLTGLPTTNLARPGSQVTDAKIVAKQVKPDDRVVLLEIGGNDLLSGEPSDEFARGLEASLFELSASGRTVAMFELPLLPGKIAYGRVQRKLATKYGVWLIPKRYFADVISGADATSDGLHLSTTGTRRMAILVARALSRVLKSQSQLPSV